MVLNLEDTYRTALLDNRLAYSPIGANNARYWGKRDTALILPTNSSLSVTLDQDHLRSTTTSRCDPTFEAGDKLWLNGKEDVIKAGGRLDVCIREMRGLRGEMEAKDSTLPTVSMGLCKLESGHCPIVPRHISTSDDMRYR